MAEMTTPIDFMHQLMYKLQYTYDNDSNKLNLALADLTNIDGLTQITDWTQLRDMIKADITTNLNNGGDGKKFLKDYCNIDLDNEDCGALIGFDCSGGDILNNDNIIEETGDLQTHPSSAVIGGCNITFPTFSDSKYNYVMDGLYTWWIGLPFELVKKSFGLEFNSDSFVNSMPVDLYDDPPSGGVITGAYVLSSYSLITFQTISLILKVNMNSAAYGAIIIGDKSGNTTNSWAALDRTLAHELTHAVMSANIRGFNAWLPMWFKEGGTAELVNGCDDSRTSALLYDAVTPSAIDEGFANPPTGIHEYDVGFIAIRYLLKKYTDRQQKIIFPVKPKEPFEKVWEKMAHGIRSEYCISRDGDLNKIMDEFVDFCQRDDYNLVQPWTLCSNEGSKTLRIPLEGHEKKTEDVVCTFGASMPPSDSYAFLSTSLSTGAGATTGCGPAFASTVFQINQKIMYYDINNYLAASSLPYFSGFYYLPVSEQEIIDDFNLLGQACAVILIQGNDVTAFSNNLYNTLAQDFTLIVFQLDKIPLLTVDFDTISDEDFMAYFDSENDSAEEKDVQALIENIGIFYDMRSIIINSLVAVKPSDESLGQFYKRLIMSNYVGVFKINGEYGLFSNTELHCPLSFHNAITHACVGVHFPLIQPKFDSSEKYSTDFPCFYLSTGVFKPSTWNGQGLTYPSSAVSNVNDEYIPFNIHVLNDINMRFDLQGIGTCKKVTGKQGDADVLNSIKATETGYYTADTISDVIPGIGCPLIVRSVENKEKYNTIECYFTKTSYSGTFTLIFWNENDETTTPVFQSVAFGLGISEEESYKYPLYTAGGTSGLYPSYYSFTYVPPVPKADPVTLHVYGNEFNFDMSKGDTLNSLLYPLTTYRCGISNVRILQPSGEWKSAINYKQVFYENGKDTIGAAVNKNDSNDVEDYLVYPTISNTKLVDRFTLVQPVSIIKKHLTGENESGFTMSFNGVKCKPDRLRSMLQGLDGHEYLIVPNGWFDRKLGIPLRPLVQNESLIDVIVDLMDKMPTQEYVLCIDLG